MAEKQKTPQELQDADINDRATRIATALIGTVAIVSGVAAVDHTRRTHIEDTVRERQVQEQEHQQAMLEEINAKSTVPLTSEEGLENVVAYIPPVGTSDLYGEAITRIPGDTEDLTFVTYTITESAKDQGTYQPDDSFALTHDTIDGRETLIVRKVDDSLAASIEQ